MQNTALKSRPVLTVPTLRETTLFLLPHLNMPESIEEIGEDNDFIFTKHHSPTSD